MSDAGDMRFGAESAKAFLANSTGSFAGFLATVLFARLFEPSGFGGFYLLYALVFLFDLPLRGLAGATRKRYSEVDTDRGAIVGATLLVTLCYPAVLTAVVVALLPVLPVVPASLTALTGVADAWLVFLSMTLAANLFILFQRLLGAAGNVGQQAGLDAVQTVLGVAGQTAFVVGLGFGTAGMGYGLVAAWLVGTLLAIWLLDLPASLPGSGPRMATASWTRRLSAAARSLWAYARYSISTLVFKRGYDRIDVVVLGTLATTAAAGNYEVAAKLVIPASFVSSAIGSAVLPLVSNRHSKGEAAADTLSEAVSYVSILAIPLFFGSLAVPRRLVLTIYGSEYGLAATLLAGLALFQLIMTWGEVCQQGLGGIDRPDLQFRANAWTFGVDLVVLVVLLGSIHLFLSPAPRVLAIAVVVATVVAESVRFGLLYRFLRDQVDGFGVDRRLIADQIVAGTVMWAAVTGAKRVVPAGGLPWLDPRLGLGLDLDIGAAIGLLLLLALGGAVYGTALLAVSARTRGTVAAVGRDLLA